MLKSQYQTVADFSRLKIYSNGSSLKNFYRTLSNRERPKLSDNHTQEYIVIGLNIAQFSAPRERINRQRIKKMQKLSFFNAAYVGLIKKLYFLHL